MKLWKAKFCPVPNSCKMTIGINQKNYKGQTNEKILRLFMIKVACRDKTNTTWTVKNTTSFYYFSKKIKTNTLQGHKSYIKIFELEIQSTLAISNMCYLEFRTISNFFLGPFSIYGLLPYKISRYLEVRYLELFSISN